MMNSFSHKNKKGHGFAAHGLLGFVFVVCYFTVFLKTTGGFAYVQAEEERDPTRGWAGCSQYRCSLFVQPPSLPIPLISLSPVFRMEFAS